MLMRLLLVPVYLVLLLSDILITILHKDFIHTLVFTGSCLALLSLVTGVLAVAYLSVAFLILFLIPAMGYLLIMMRTYGSQVEVEASVDVGVVCGVMAWTLLTVLSLLVPSLSCTL